MFSRFHESPDFYDETSTHCSVVKDPSINYEAEGQDACAPVLGARQRAFISRGDNRKRFSPFHRIREILISHHFSPPAFLVDDPFRDPRFDRFRNALLVSRS